MKIIGLNIKERRVKCDLTLRELAKRLNVSASFISQVESGKTTPSLASIKHIAHELKTTVGELIGDDCEHKNSPVMRVSDRLSKGGMSKGINMSLLTTKEPTKQLEPVLFELQEGASSGKSFYKHFGQEFAFVLRGAVEITLNDTTYALTMGDSIYFYSHIPHSFKNIFAGVSEILWIASPPTF